MVEQALTLLDVLLAIPEACRSHRRERIGEHVVEVDAWEAVGCEVLVHDAGRDRQRIIRLHEQRHASASAIAVVLGLVKAAARLNGIDESRQVVPVGDDARRGLVAERQIECASGVSTRITMRGRFERGVGHRFCFAELWLAGDVAHGARLGSGAEERPLGPTQHLEALEVEQLEIGREEGHRNR